MPATDRREICARARVGGGECRGRMQIRVSGFRARTYVEAFSSEDNVHQVRVQQTVFENLFPHLF